MADDAEQPNPDASPGGDSPAFEGAEAQENASGDTLSPLKNENGSPFGKANKFGKWSVVKAKMVTDPKPHPQTLSESFQRLVRQKAVQEGVDLPLSEALRKEEAKTRRISKMKFTTSTVEQMKTEYHTRNAKDAKTIEMEKNWKPKAFISGASDRSNAGMSFTARDPYAYLRTPNSKEPHKELPPVQQRSQSTSPTKFTSHPSYHPIERSSSTSPTQVEFLRTPPGRWRPRAVPSFIAENGNWCSSWKFTKVPNYEPSKSPILTQQSSPTALQRSPFADRLSPLNHSPPPAGRVAGPPSRYGSMSPSPPGGRLAPISPGRLSRGIQAGGSPQPGRSNMNTPSV